MERLELCTFCAGKCLQLCLSTESLWKGGVPTLVTPLRPDSSFSQSCLGRAAVCKQGMSWVCYPGGHGKTCDVSNWVFEVQCWNGKGCVQGVPDCALLGHVLIRGGQRKLRPCCWPPCWGKGGMANDTHASASAILPCHSGMVGWHVNGVEGKFLLPSAALWGAQNKLEMWSSVGGNDALAGGRW